MRTKLIAATAVLLALASGASAQTTGTTKPKATLNTEVSQQLPDNTSNAITPANVRQVFVDSIASFQQAPQVNAQTGTSYTFLATDYGNLVTFNNASAVAVTLPQATGSFNPWNVYVRNLGAGTVTITPTTSTINGASSFALPTNATAYIVADGTNYQVANASTNGSLANMAAGTIKGNNTGSSGPPLDLTGLQAEGVLQFLQTGTGAVQRSLDSWLKSNAIHASDFVAAGAVNAQNTTVNVTITGGTSALTVGTATFASTDCQSGTGCTGTNGNKVITIGGIGTAGAPLQTTIAGFTSSTQITLGANAITGVTATSEPIVWGTDNTTALQNWLTACQPTACYLDNGRYLVTSTLTTSGTLNLTIFGSGRFTSEIIQANVSIGIINYTTTNAGLGAQLYYFRLSQYMPQTANVALVNFTGSGVQQLASTLADVYLWGGNNALFATNVQYLNIDRNIWINQSNNGMFYDYPLTCATGIGKIENSFVAPLSGGTGLSFGSEGGFTIINNDITTQGNQTGTGISFSSTQACAGGDVYISQNNLENWSVGIQFSKGSETTGGANHVDHNDFFNNAVSINAGDGNASWLLDLSIDGNQFYCVTACITVTNSVRNTAIVGNTFRQQSGTPTGINITGNAVTGIAKGNTFAGMTTNVSNASPVFYAESLNNGHLKSVGVAPTISTTNCPSAAVTSGSTDEAGAATYTNTATSCVVTFAQSYSAAPFCTANLNGGSSSGAAVVTSTTTMTVSFATGSTGLAWNCRGN